MLKSLIVLAVGLIVGAGGTFLMFRAPQIPQEAPTVVAPAVVACESEVARQRAVISELEKKVTASDSGKEQVQATAEISHGAPSTGEERVADDRAISWKVSAIEKFVPLTPEQKERLRAKFQEEQSAKAADRDSSAETLDVIIGEEAASTYRQQVKAAFERVQNEELDKEAVWISHKLSLSPAQEASMRRVFAEVESQINQELGDSSHTSPQSGQERVMRMVAENKKRIQLRSEALKTVLTPEQYNTYVQTEAQSANADMEVFHDPGAAE